MMLNILIHKICLCDVYELNCFCPCTATSLTDELVLMEVWEDLIIESVCFLFSAAPSDIRDVSRSIKHSFYSFSTRNWFPICTLESSHSTPVLEAFTSHKEGELWSGHRARHENQPRSRRRTYFDVSFARKIFFYDCFGAIFSFFLLFWFQWPMKDSN